jgi:hypothetical protein
MSSQSKSEPKKGSVIDREADAEILAEITIAALMSPQDPVCREIILNVADWLGEVADRARGFGSEP